MTLWSLRRPGDREITRFSAEQRNLDYSYTHIGATRGTIPSGWTVEHHRRRLGRGASCFATARDAMRVWRMFPEAWARIAPAVPPVEHETFVVLLRVARVWWLNAIRVVYLDDEPRRFAFAVGTLPGHIALGEESFSLHHAEDDSVWYELRAFTRQRMLAARLASPVSRAVRAQFVRDSLAEMSRAVEGPGMVRP
ncbi:MAG: DUF1990 family protein [Kofleriaceae bacterium]